ncbi:related to lysophospholipase L1 and related esterases [Fusarium mangiferae]|uniref:Related to lysophospholipase L1 and related esterases n=1 Tax=Fusarium mangiferae TaxID=192010 RepID=A0A1L7UGW4_FUSMA|nr:related to lysophospholipase L1 and related esterases [Fusarium mangiferae]CVL06987.1 related to lysophospholipase L1 and related esterases [Fusarium mangiferae]
MESPSKWVTAWAPIPQPTEEADMPPYPFTQREVAFQNTTIRQTLRVTAGGDYIRIRLSNQFGLEALHISRAVIAVPRPHNSVAPGGSPSILKDTAQHVLFDGEQPVLVPAGSHVLSDSLKFPVSAGQILSITIFLQKGQNSQQITSHPGSRTDSWLCYGDQSMAPELSGPESQASTHWYFLSGVEIRVDAAHHGALVLLGDSITDGRCSTDNANNRWPDFLFKHMQQHPFAQNISIINQAVGGGRVLQDGKGPSLLSRLDRDAIAQPGRRYILVFHGVNDLGTANSDLASLQEVTKALRKAYRQIVSRCHAHGLHVLGATIGPMGGNEPYGTCELRERARQELNDWIRKSCVFDALVDFDHILRSTEDSSRLKEEYDSGDHLHPNIVAFDAMAAGFPLDVFEQFEP